MHVYEDLKEILCKELEEITRKGELTAGTLDTVDKLTHSIKSIETIMAMDEYEDDYSNRSSYDGMSYARGDGRGRSYNRGNSYARAGRRSNVRRDSMGRYSRDEAEDELMESLHEYMRATDDPTKKQEVQRFLNKLDNMI